MGSSVTSFEYTPVAGTGPLKVRSIRPGHLLERGFEQRGSQAGHPASGLRPDEISGLQIWNGRSPDLPGHR